MMNKIIMLVAIAIATISCSKVDCTDVFTMQEFFIENENGKDLLIDTDAVSKNLSVYYLIDGELIKQDKGYYLSKYDDNKNMLFLFLNETPSEGDMSYTYIKWGNDDMDIIESQVFKKEKGDCFIHHVTMKAFNDHKWTRNEVENEYIFTIIKE